MQLQIWIRVMTAVVVVSAAFGAGAVNAAAQGETAGCSAATIRGTYGIQLHGTRPVPPALGGGMESVIGVVVRTYDGMGNVTQIDNVKGSVTGITPDRPGFGTYQVSADCTATAEFQPAPGVIILEQMVIVEGGAEIRGMTVSPLAVMVTSVHKRITASAGTPVAPPPPPSPCPGTDPFAAIPGLVGDCVNGGWVPRSR